VKEEYSGVSNDIDLSEVLLIPYSDWYKESLFEFTHRCFAELGKAFEPDGRHSFYNDISDSFASFYCLIKDDIVIGSVGIKKMNDEEAELKALYLDSEFRGMGYGKKLLNKAIESAGELGFKGIFLDSMSQYKDALRLYERSGFVMTERFNDNPYADVFMRLELE